MVLKKMAGSNIRFNYLEDMKLSRESQKQKLNGILVVLEGLETFDKSCSIFCRKRKVPVLIKIFLIKAT